MNPNLIIESDRLSINKMDESMCNDVYSNSLDEDVKKYVPDEVFDSIENVKKAIKQIIKNYENEDGPFIYAVIKKEDNQNIGYVQLIKIEEGWEIGYHIAKKYTGKGYATEAVKLFLQYIKDNTNLNKVYGITLIENIASRRVLEKCGFVLLYEGEAIYQGTNRKIVKTVKILRK